MRSKLFAFFAIATALLFGNTTVATARPEGGDTKTVTYSITIKSGSGIDTFIDYESGGWNLWTHSDGPWSKTVQLSQGVAPNIYVYSRARNYQWPVYVCTITVDGVLKVQNEGYGGVQCLQGYNF